MPDPYSYTSVPGTYGYNTYRVNGGWAPVMY